MGYLSESGFDIFISYAHRDNVTLSGEEGEGWISSFDRALRVRLEQVLGADVSVWRDIELKGNEDFSDEILDQFSNVAILIPVITPSYINSEWCIRELDAFCRAFEERGSFKIKNKSRIFKVLKTHVPFDEHPETVRGLLGYPFYDESDTGGAPIEFSLDAVEPDHARLFKKKLDDLAWQIKDMLRDLKTGAVVDNSGGDGAGTEGRKNPVVYIAGSTSDVSDERDNILRELQDHQYDFLPKKELRIMSLDELVEVIDEDLSQCNLAIHLIGERYGHVPEGERHSLDAIQNEIAAKKCEEAGMPRIIWMPQGLKSADERQQAFIELLEKDPNAQKGADLIQEPLESLKSIIHDKLKRLRAKEDASNDEKSDEPLVLYLLCDESDYSATEQLDEFLYNAGFEVVLPLMDGDEKLRKREHDRQMAECDGVLLFCGEAGEAWLRDMVAELDEIDKSVGVFFAPPALPFKRRFRRRDLTVIQGVEDFNPDDMTVFVEKLAR